MSPNATATTIHGRQAGNATATGDNSRETKWETQQRETIHWRQHKRNINENTMAQVSVGNKTEYEKKRKGGINTGPTESNGNITFFFLDKKK